MTTSNYDHLVVEGPDFLTEEVGVTAPIITGILQSEGIAIAAGDKGTGKTWWGADLILSVAHARPFLGHYPVLRSGRVLVIVTEGSATGWKARMRSQAIGKGVDPEHALDGVAVIFRKSVYLDDAQFIDWLVTRASAYVLIVADVLRDAWTGDENSTADAARLVRGLRAVTNQGATVMLLHHTGKPGDRPRSLRHQVRGSSVLVDAADSLLYLERSKAGRVKVSVESRDDIPAEPFTFAIPAAHVDGTEPVDLDWQPHSSSSSRADETDQPDNLADIKTRILEVLEAAPNGLSGSAIRGKAKPASPNRVVDALWELVAVGVLEVSDGPRGAHLYRLSVTTAATATQTASAPLRPVPVVSTPIKGGGIQVEGTSQAGGADLYPVQVGYKSDTGRCKSNGMPVAGTETAVEAESQP